MRKTRKTRKTKAMALVLVVAGSVVFAGVAQEQKLTDEALDTVVRYIAAEVIATGRIDFTGDEIAAATGVHIPDSESESLRVQSAVLRELMSTPEGLSCLSKLENVSAEEGFRCTRYNACSLWGDLSTANGQILEMYERERQEDGRTYETFDLPELDAFDLEGKETSSNAIGGGPVLVSFLAVHCIHSMRAFPILEELYQANRSRGLRVLAILVNSGSVEDVNTWIDEFETSYPIWVHPEDSLGDRWGSHLVPSYFFVAADGRVREKLVGEKSKDALAERIRALFMTQSAR